MAPLQVLNDVGGINLDLYLRQRVQNGWQQVRQKPVTDQSGRRYADNLSVRGISNACERLRQRPHGRIHITGLFQNGSGRRDGFQPCAPAMEQHLAAQRFQFPYLAPDSRLRCPKPARCSAQGSCLCNGNKGADQAPVQVGVFGIAIHT